MIVIAPPNIKYTEIFSERKIIEKNTVSRGDRFDSVVTLLTAIVRNA
jgi:hypothetical protein